MGIRDVKLLPASNIAIKSYDVGLDAAVAVSLTDRIFAVRAPGYEFQLLPAQVWARVVAGAVALNVWVVNAAGVIGSTATLAINATPEKFQTAAFVYSIAQKTYAKATTSAAGVAFTLAHVVAATKYGCVLVQINAAGTISTKVAAATQTYATAALALAALPAADSGNIAIGYLAILAGVAAWTANTDDMTGGSDLVSCAFNSTAAVTTPAISAMAPLAGTCVTSGTPTFALGHGDSDGIIVCAVTTDGTGDITDAVLNINWRPFPLDGEIARPAVSG